MLPRDMDHHIKQDTDYNYGALAYAVYAPCDVTVEGALARTAGFTTPGLELIDAETLDFLLLYKTGFSYASIGDFFNVGKDLVYSRLKRWRDQPCRQISV